MHRADRLKRQEVQAINDTLQGNYWAGGQGYKNAGGPVSNLLYEAGGKGGKTTSTASQQDKIVVGYGRKNPNIARKKV